MIPVLNFGLSLEVEAQLQYSLSLGATEFLADLAFIVVLKTHAVELLP
jgi:hypothetical protein